MGALATVDQLASFMQLPSLASDDPTATLLLDIASAMVRDELLQLLDLVEDDTVLLDPLNGAYVQLPELPVTAVTLVETYDNQAAAWTTQAPSSYTVSKRLGMISALPGCGVAWPSLPESWRVTYTHGFATLPSSLLGVVLGVAARAYTNPEYIDMERIGGYQVKYAMEADGFAPLEQKALARYRVGAIS